MIIRILRRWFTDIATIGELYIDGKFFCYTLEDTTRKPGDKIGGQTAIPFGKYDFIVNYSPKFKKDMPLLLNVPGFEGVRLHAGLIPEHTEGCVLVGYEKGKNKIARSREAYKDLMAIITSRGGKGIIEITPSITIM